MNSKGNVCGYAAGVLAFQVGAGNGNICDPFARALHRQQIHRTIDAAAGIPSAGRLSVAHKHCQHVLTLDQHVRDIQPERVITVVVASHKPAVQVDGRFHVYAVKVEQRLIAQHGISDCKFAPIPRIPAVQIAPFIGGRTVGVKVVIDAPVMRHSHALPCTVVKAGCCFCRAGVTEVGSITYFVEFPATPWYLRTRKSKGLCFMGTPQQTAVQRICPGKSVAADIKRPG